MNHKIKEHISSSIATKKALLDDLEVLSAIEQASQLVIDTYKAGNKTLLAGNGGSAADAQHIAGEFVSRFYFDRPGLSSIALTTDSSVMTAISNDYGYEKIFSRQIQAMGNEGDVFIGLSTSGNSANVIDALMRCKEKGIKTIGLTGITGGNMADLCDICIRVPSPDTPRIQESHILIGHILCYLVEEAIFGHIK
jgi:D-sedoheptulose 7-phosphate isomerase